MSSQTQPQRRQQYVPQYDDGVEAKHHRHPRRHLKSSPISYVHKNMEYSKASELYHSVTPRKCTLMSRSTATTTTSAPTALQTNNSGSDDGDNKVVVGSSDYLVLRRNGHPDQVFGSSDGSIVTNSYFDSDASNSAKSEVPTKKGMSRLTKKLSKHKKPPNEFPADEITEGASIADESSHEADYTLEKNSIIHTSTTATTSSRENIMCHKYNGDHCYNADDKRKTSNVGGYGRICAKIQNDDVHQSIEESLLLLDVSASRTSVSTSTCDSNCIGKGHLIDLNHAVGVAKTKDQLNITSNSSIPTYNSYGSSLPSKQGHRPALHNAGKTTEENTVSRYNHYDWSYTEETTAATLSTPTPSTTEKQKGPSRAALHSATVVDCDDSTLSTTIISNISMDFVNASTNTTDTSFEATIDAGPFVVFPAQQSETTTLSKTRTKKKVTINEGQSHGKNRPVTPSTTLRSPIEHDTLVIVEDDEKTLEFRHTSLILQYASVELAKYFVGYNRKDSDEERDHDTIRATRKGDDNNMQFMLHVNVQDANDWRSLQPFLEPHAVQPAMVTPNNLPVLLPWFQQLKLNVLLQECDMQLSCHLLTPPTSRTSLDQFRTIISDDCNVGAENDDYLTLWNTIRLGEIAVKAGLERTAKQAFIVATGWLKRFPNVWLQQPSQCYPSTTLLVQALALLVQCLLDPNIDDSINESQDTETSFESTDSSNWESMFQPTEASYLFSAMIMYLPLDCVEQQRLYCYKNLQQLLINPLCPYLIREGIQKKESTDPVATELEGNKESSDTIDNGMFNELSSVPIASSSEIVEVIADNETIITENLSPTSLQRRQLEQAFNDRRGNEGNSKDTSSSLLQVAEDIHAGWNSLWMKLAVATSSSTGSSVENYGRERDSNNNSIYPVLSHTLSDQQSEMLLLQSPKELSEWLHIVWDKLCHPPIFGTQQHRKHYAKKRDAPNRGLDQPSHATIPSSSPSVLVSALRSKTNNTSQVVIDKNTVTNTNDDTMNTSSRRTFAC